jgi:hypothetical protein
MKGEEKAKDRQRAGLSIEAGDLQCSEQHSLVPWQERRASPESVVARCNEAKKTDCFQRNMKREGHHRSKEAAIQ